MRVLRVSLPLLLLPASAFAVRPVDDHHASIELANGAIARPQIEIDHGAPEHHLAWKRFVESAGGSWKSMWDRDTGVPVRIWGSGIAAPNSGASPKAAEEFARDFIAKHLDLLAPGASIDDFVLASNELSNGVRTVGFFQTRHGVPVARGQVSLRFKKDRMIAIGSEAFPNLDVALGSGVARDEAVRAALDWNPGRFEKVLDPVIRAIVLEGGGIAAAHVLPVIVWTRDPIGRWEVDIDLRTGKPFARRQTLMFASGSIKFRVPDRYPGGRLVEAPAPQTNVTIDGVAGRTAEDGTITWTSSAAAQVVVSPFGPMVSITNEAGETASTTLSLSDGGTAVWDESANEMRDAQLTTFIAARRVRDYVKRIAPNLRFLNEQILAYVNIADTCNAFSDGTTINFLRAGRQCENTGRLVDVVMHEYGHSIHAHAIIPGVGDFESALSEGGADYLAATVTNDPGMGRGFFYTDEPLRHIDPPNREAVWPGDRGEPHVTGEIYGGAMWDLRKYLIEQYGEATGVEMTDRFWFATFQRASSIPTSYVEILVEDDDDGDLANGTPNICGITDIFRAHGLASAAEAGLSIGTVSLDDWRVVLPVTERGLCPGFDVLSATLVWNVRGQEGSGATVAMTKMLGGLEATIPPQPEGEVLRYHVTLELANGERIAFPDNPADPFYEAFIGETTPIYCTDFERDPHDEGWTHEMLYGQGRRARDEWEWGAPNADPGSGDPTEAYSGNYVMGNDLGQTMFSFGTYSRNKIEELVSPPIDVNGHQKVRLQYRRWLTIEDGDFDQAEILVGDTTLWSNHASGTGQVHHIDREWRFHDVDLTEVAAQNGGIIQVKFRLTSDEGLQLGGWTIDDFCVSGWNGPIAQCGDGKVDFGEVCDDGNQTSGDGCEADCTVTVAAVCGNGTVESGEQCDDGNVVDGDGCSASCMIQKTEEPKLIEDESGCACTANARVNAHAWLSLILLLGFLTLRRKR